MLDITTEEDVNSVVEGELNQLVLSLLVLAISQSAGHYQRGGSELACVLTSGLLHWCQQQVLEPRSVDVVSAPSMIALAKI